MIIKKDSRIAVYKYLMTEGVLYAEKDPNLPKHPAFPGTENTPAVSNLEVMKLMQSFVSKKYVTELFAWRHFYWFLTDEGIKYIREYLVLPEKVIPKTLKKDKRPPAEKRGGGGRERRDFGDRGGREGYRSGFGRGGGGGDKGFGSAPG